ncbi:MAG TPA: tryptophan-rich sensory protein, partial [Lachnospiraceae bacterium]|nr:tryptophan-rich sensory protein [Lachnospiraceae bacterium]
PGIWMKLLTILTFVLMLAVNTLAVVLPINGVSTGQAADAYPNLFTPAGITFSIWSLIYILLAAHVLYVLGLFREKETGIDVQIFRRICVTFSISSAVNAAWIFSWHYGKILLSMLLMLILLNCLIKINVMISKQTLSAKERFFVRLPFTVYFGWITIATIANAAVLLVSVGWDRFGLSENIWTVIMLLAGMLIGLAVLLRFKTVSYSLVLIWAYTGILIKHTSVSGFAGQYPAVIITAGICLALFAASAGYLLLHFSLKGGQ